LQLHQIGLPLNVFQALKSLKTGPEANSYQKPTWNVCRGQQFTPWIAGRLGIGFLFMLGGSILYLDCRRRWLNWLGVVLFALSWLILLAPVPWNLGPCFVDKPTNEAQYRQTFSHDKPKPITTHIISRDYNRT